MANILRPLPNHKCVDPQYVFVLYRLRRVLGGTNHLVICMLQWLLLHSTLVYTEGVPVRVFW